MYKDCFEGSLLETMEIQFEIDFWQSKQLSAIKFIGRNNSNNLLTNIVQKVIDQITEIVDLGHQLPKTQYF